MTNETIEALKLAAWEPEPGMMIVYPETGRAIRLGEKHWNRPEEWFASAREGWSQPSLNGIRQGVPDLDDWLTQQIIMSQLAKGRRLAVDNGLTWTRRCGDKTDAYDLGDGWDTYRFVAEQVPGLKNGMNLIEALAVCFAHTKPKSPDLQVGQVWRSKAHGEVRIAGLGHYSTCTWYGQGVMFYRIRLEAPELTFIWQCTYFLETFTFVCAP